LDEKNKMPRWEELHHPWKTGRIKFDQFGWPPTANRVEIEQVRADPHCIDPWGMTIITENVIINGRKLSSGLVVSVDAGGQMDRLGVRPGWRLWCFDGYIDYSPFEEAFYSFGGYAKFFQEDWYKDPNVYLWKRKHRMGIAYQGQSFQKKTDRTTLIFVIERHRSFPNIRKELKLGSQAILNGWANLSGKVNLDNFEMLSEWYQHGDGKYWYWGKRENGYASVYTRDIGFALRLYDDCIGRCDVGITLLEFINEEYSNDQDSLLFVTMIMDFVYGQWPRFSYHQTSCEKDLQKQKDLCVQEVRLFRSALNNPDVSSKRYIKSSKRGIEFSAHTVRNFANRTFCRKMGKFTMLHAEVEEDLCREDFMTKNMVLVRQDRNSKMNKQPYLETLFEKNGKRRELRKAGVKLRSKKRSERNRSKKHQHQVRRSMRQEKVWFNHQYLQTNL